MSVIFKTIADLAQITPGNLPQPSADKAHLLTIKNYVLNIIGAMALLLITINGFRYILSAGDSQKAARARNGIIFALVGLAIAIVSDAIVTLVINKVAG